METTMTLEKYKSMKKAKNVREEKKLKNIDIDALIKKRSKKSSSNVRSEFRNNYKNYQYDYEEDFYEPYLLQIGFIERTPRGRRVTPRARKHLELL